MKKLQQLPILLILIDMLKITAFGQGYVENNIIDSLQRELNKPNLHDTTYIILLAEIGEQKLIFRIGYWDTIVKLSEKKLTANPPIHVAKVLKNSLADALNNIGYVYKNQGEIEKALEYLHQSLEIRKEFGNKEGIATSLNNIGAIYRNQGQIEKALEYHYQSLKIRKEIGNKEGIATSLNNIGIIYGNQGQIEKALEYLHQSLEIRKEFGNKEGIATSLNNIGSFYRNQGQIEKALEYYHQSLKIYGIT